MLHMFADLHHIEIATLDIIHMNTNETSVKPLAIVQQSGGFSCMQTWVEPTCTSYKDASAQRATRNATELCRLGELRLAAEPKDAVWPSCSSP